MAIFSFCWRASEGGRYAASNTVLHTPSHPLIHPYSLAPAHPQLCVRVHVCACACVHLRVFVYVSVVQDKLEALVQDARADFDTIKAQVDAKREALQACDSSLKTIVKEKERLSKQMAATTAEVKQLEHKLKVRRRPLERRQAEAGTGGGRKGI